MATYNRPGVYVNELPLLAGPVVTSGTANAAAAIVAAFPQGPSQITKVTSWYDFKRLFGDYNSAYPSTYAVGQFFKNGGTELYVRRVLRTTDTTVANNAVAGSVAVKSSATGQSSTNAFTVTAKSLGADGNALRVRITKTVGIATNAYDVVVYRESVLNGNTNETLLEKFSGVVFDDVNSSDYAPTVLQYGSVFIKITGINAHVDGDGLQDYALPIVNGAIGTETAYYTLSGAVGNKPLSKYDYVGGTVAVVDPNASPLTYAYTEGTQIMDEFLVVNQPLVFFFPDLVQRLGATWSNVTYVVNKYIEFAENTGGFVIAETGAIGDGAVTTALTNGNDFTASAHAAVYFPNLYIRDNLGNSGSSIRLVGPSAAVAGIMLATDRAVGPFKTPGGLNSRIVDAVALEHAFTDAELDQLNSGLTAAGSQKKPINAIRNLPGAGISIMGGRTLLQDGTANRYIAMRRSLIYVEKRLKDLAEFAIFESNDETLWARMKTILGNFLNEYRNQGGLRGETPDAAFFVKCDSENNTTASIAAGEVHVEVGVALEYPAEFVVINLSQKTAE